MISYSPAFRAWDSETRTMIRGFPTIYPTKKYPSGVTGFIDTENNCFLEKKDIIIMQRVCVLPSKVEIFDADIIRQTHFGSVEVGYVEQKGSSIGDWYFVCRKQHNTLHKYTHASIEQAIQEDAIVLGNKYATPEKYREIESLKDGF